MSVKKHCSSSTKLITCIPTSSPNLIYSLIFCSKVRDEKRVHFSLIRGLISNGFCIANLALFFMIRTNKDLCKSNAMAKNSPKTHTS